ncbi:MAG: hypothetical protein ACRCXZ_05465 [Patescibacteria group bacterium]
MFSVFQFRLNSTGQFEEISEERAITELREHLNLIILKKLGKTNTKEKVLLQFGDSGLKELDVETLLQLAISVGCSEEDIFFQEYKLNISYPDCPEVTFDFRDLDLLDGKSGFYLMDTLSKFIPFTETAPIPLYFENSMPLEYSHSILVLFNDQTNGTTSKFYRKTHTEYNKVLKYYQKYMLKND